MAISRNSDRIDHLSSLPDELLITILSSLPTLDAARTSALCRRFRHLWKACHAVNISFKSNLFKDPKFFIDMAKSALLSRQPSNGNPLLSLHLTIPCWLPFGLTHSFICSLLAHARSLRIRHLTLESSSNFDSSICSVYFITSLESLSIHLYSRDTDFLSATTLTRLKSLSIHLHSDKKIAQVKRILSELSCLEHFQLTIDCGVEEVTLSSLTIKKLQLACDFHGSVGLFMPSLESLYLSNRCGPSIPLFLKYGNIPHIHGDIPSLIKCTITLDYFNRNHVTNIAQLLNCISHVEELSLDLQEKILFSEYPFGILLEPGKEAPYFGNLRYLDACMCFHEHNFEAIVSLLNQSPALQSLKLVHKAARNDTCGIKKRTLEDWRSKLPRNADGNNQQVCFSNLHLKENNKEFMELLNKKSTCKKQRAHH